MTVHLRRSSLDLLHYKILLDIPFKDSITFYVLRLCERGLILNAVCTDSVGDVATAGCRGSDKAPIVHSREIEAAPSCDLHLQNCDTIMSPSTASDRCDRPIAE